MTSWDERRLQRSDSTEPLPLTEIVETVFPVALAASRMAALTETTAIPELPHDDISMTMLPELIAKS